MYSDAVVWLFSNGCHYWSFELCRACQPSLPPGFLLLTLAPGGSTSSSSFLSLTFISSLSGAGVIREGSYSPASSLRSAFGLRRPTRCSWVLSFSRPNPMPVASLLQDIPLPTPIWLLFTSLIVPPLGMSWQPSWPEYQATDKTVAPPPPPPKLYSHPMC